MAFTLHLYTSFIALGLGAIFKGRVEQHRGWMRGAYLGLVEAFIGTLAPGRWLALQLGWW